MPFTFELSEIRTKSDPDLLDRFFDQLESFFDNVLEGRVGAVDISSEIESEISVLRVLIADIRERDAFSIAKSAVRDSAEGLANVGLSGVALRAKLSTLHRLSNPVRSGIRKGLKYLLSILNSILGSLSKALGAIGGAVVHGMKEIKEFIEAKLDAASDL